MKIFYLGPNGTNSDVAARSIFKESKSIFIGLNSIEEIFEKLFQYGLYMRECGKLEFVLYDTSVTMTSTSQRLFTVNASSKTLTVRSNEEIIKPGEWNHICVTYDGSSTRAGMKIYVNCVDVTNTSDVPASGAAKTFSITNGTGEQTGIGYLGWYLSLNTGDDHEKENPADYTAMHSHNTPLLFSNQIWFF